MIETEATLEANLVEPSGCAFDTSGDLTNQNECNSAFEVVHVMTSQPILRFSVDPKRAEFFRLGINQQLPVDQKGRNWSSY